MTDRGIIERLGTEVIAPGICTGCGACSVLAGIPVGSGVRQPTKPDLSLAASLPPLAWDACPGKGIDYPALYRAHYGSLPENWLVGHIVSVRIGHASDEGVRRNGASGGVTTAVLCHLLESGRIDGAIVAKQGVPTPEEAAPIIATGRQEILAAAQSVYIPVPMLSILPELEPGKRYAMTCTPDQAAALRVLQQGGHPPALQIEYVLGPYTGTALEPGAIRCLLRSHCVADSDPITSLKWRAGEWPGYLEIQTGSGRTIRSKKVYYNFLIPFFVTQNSLQSMDFANEFCDLAVGDAWSPKFEALGAGFSIVVARSEVMESVLQEMMAKGLLTLKDEDPVKATEMHGHMIDFKKRGGYIRNTWRRKLGMAAPDYGMRPDMIPVSRYVVECVISGLFLACRNRVARKLLEFVPESIIGPLFNRLRLLWKSASKPTKRKGLGNLKMIPSRVP